MFILKATGSTAPGLTVVKQEQLLCCCLLLQYVLESCSRGGRGDSGGRVL